ncbi:MAG: hypothetical protein Q8P33_01630 [bacterium]|nr:hypothetical protein [bacterium]
MNKNNNQPLDLNDLAAMIARSFDEQNKLLEQRFSAIDQRFEGVDKRFLGVDKRLENLEKGQGELQETVAGHGQQLFSLQRQVDVVIGDLAHIKKVI